MTDIISWKEGILSSLHFDIYNDGANTVLCSQNKSWYLLTNVTYVYVHNQGKPLPPRTLQQELDQIKLTISKILSLILRFCTR